MPRFERNHNVKLHTSFIIITFSMLSIFKTESQKRNSGKRTHENIKIEIDCDVDMLMKPVVVAYKIYSFLQEVYRNLAPPAADWPRQILKLTD